MNTAGIIPTIVLTKDVNIKPKTISEFLMGVINKWHKFLDQISSKNVIDKPNCPLKSISHNITAVNRIETELYCEIFWLSKKEEKNPHKTICIEGHHKILRILGNEPKMRVLYLRNNARILKYMTKLIYLKKVVQSFCSYFFLWDLWEGL